MTYTYTFTVERATLLGGSFPIDMLRYDGCFPGSQEAVHSIVYSIINIDRRDKLPTGEKVNLTRVTSLPFWKPTSARWESFNWRVISSSVRRIKQ